MALMMNRTGELACELRSKVCLFLGLGCERPNNLAEEMIDQIVCWEEEGNWGIYPKTN
jgi:hypothetical protein